jgi:hypothetical protein
MPLSARAALATTVLLAVPVLAHADPAYTAGNLLISSSVYNLPARTIVVGQTVLPGGSGATAVADASYPNVFQNEAPDPSFGITTPITISQVTQSGAVVSSQILSGITTSFPSKSEGGLSLSADGRSVTLMGYNAAPGLLDVSNSNTPGLLDVSNSNTPGHPDATNPVQQTYQRSIATISGTGAVTTQPVDSYSGNNGRNAITGANGVTYTVGNAGNGTSKATAAVLADQLANTGVQIVTPGSANTTSAGVYNVTQNGYAADKASKDPNFRDITINDNTVYVTKGSGGNGINTVYQVGTAGTLPTGSNNAVTILPGFNTKLASDPTANFYPFGLFFANNTTLYVADEGLAGTVTSQAGLEKWSLVNGTWQEDYILTAGLNLGTKYAVAGLDPSLDPATTGLRNLSGIVNADGTVSLFAVTATSSALTDQGADANSVVAITDLVSAMTLPGSEAFTTIAAPTYATVYRGVSQVPLAASTAVPEPISLAVMGTGLLGMFSVRRRR